MNSDGNCIIVIVFVIVTVIVIIKCVNLLFVNEEWDVQTRTRTANAFQVVAWFDRQSAYMSIALQFSSSRAGPGRLLGSWQLADHGGSIFGSKGLPLLLDPSASLSFLEDA